jgi:NADH-quinone oxidoreductase subunit G
MFEAAPVLAKLGQRPANEWKTFSGKGELSSQAFTPAIDNFYMTDPISRASPTMAECTEELLPYWNKNLEAAE